MTYKVKITAIQTHTLNVLADNRYEALEKAKDMVKHADANQYQTELESIAHITLIDAGTGYEWTIRETPSAIVWRRKENEDV